MSKNLSLNRLIELANEVYPDSLIAQNYNRKTQKATLGDHGDGLANFIVRELVATFDPRSSVLEASRVLSLASRQLESVAQHLYRS
jgi:hypothetical protein